MKYTKCLLIIFGLIISLSFFTGCEKKDEAIVFDDTYPLALAPDVEWAVVKNPYAAYKKEMGWSSSVIGHSRRGDILQILGHSVDKNDEKWCLVEKGWLPESCLNIYNNRLKAEKVSENYMKQEMQNNGK